MTTKDELGNSIYNVTRILVIEDETHIRKIIMRLLRQIGFRLIDEAEDGAKGLEELVRVKPNIVLCDIHMEPVDGLTFLKSVRSLGRRELSDLPVIFLTADTQVTTVAEAKDLRVDGYLAKPVSMKALKDRIDRVIHRT